ncbi:hypothetical protein [Sphingopyxis sp. A083]|uniref:hypothetical protein n=1 Tax=Sphingopyxis sp. A083 TaxID=1759083 RepID=UPI000736A7BB|nr:hypothetical protein [Sphingopyxis sp. A083]KTE76155.1 hypothetical protein ATE59_11765 [Sphingopyxis sp. A083]
MTCQPDRRELLKAARRVADFASTHGVPHSYAARRATYDHAGALLADAVLQAGLSYRSVVMPRVGRILKEFPDANRVSALVCLVEKNNTAHFLDWQHPTKLGRFDLLVSFLDSEEIDTIDDIRVALGSKKFRADLILLNGIGPKTIDYMSCLVGIEAIAVDRHIKTFAIKAGLENDDYDYLKNVFSVAADLLSISRREFDAWVWSREARKQSPQLDLAF